MRSAGKATRDPLRVSANPVEQSVYAKITGTQLVLPLTSIAASLIEVTAGNSMFSSPTNSQWWPTFLAGVALLVSCSVAFAANVESSVKLTKAYGTVSLTNSYCGDALPVNTSCCDYNYNPPTSDISCGFVLFYFTATEAGTATLQFSGSGPSNLFFNSGPNCNAS